MLTDRPTPDEARERVFDALGDGTRRAILDLLAQRPQAVSELAAELPVTRPAVSLHLKVLREAGLVADRPEGTRRIYRIDREGLALLRTYLDLMWARSLDAFAAAAEEAHRRAKEPPSDRQPPVDPEEQT